MKIVIKKAALLQTTLLLCGFAAPALAQAPVTVPPAAMPATMPAADAAPVIMPSAAPAMPATTAAMAPMPQPIGVAMPQPANTAMAQPVGSPIGAMPISTVGTTAAAPVMQPAMPSPSPVAVVTAPPINTPANMPAGTPTVVTQVMSNLKNAQDNVSVEDLSKAQDALTRLDLLLQIEKKIGEIKKTQDDRESGGGGPGTGSGGMIGQIPASALVMPNQAGMGMPGGAMNGSGSGMPSPVVSSPPVASSYEVEQISGTNGSYNAILKTPEGDRKTVRAGDKLDGRTVQSISLSGVQLSSAANSKGGSKKGGKTLTLHNDGVLLTPSVR